MCPRPIREGLQYRFNLAEHVHTDIVSHSTDGFPTHDGEQFLAFLRAALRKRTRCSLSKADRTISRVASRCAGISCRHPSLSHSSFARETYFGVTAFAFTSAKGQSKFGRYRIVPVRGNDYLTNEQVTRLSPNYHYDELGRRVRKGPIRFVILVQVAAGGDVTDDATVHWPEDREIIEFGHIELTDVLEDSLAQQKHIIFDPIPRVDGIEPSADPLLELRAAIYLLSGRERSAAKA